MKTFLVLIIGICIFFKGYAQESKIVKLLNQQFNSEQKMYETSDEKRPELIQPFQIENGILSFEFLYDQPDRVVSIRREVVLDKISNINKGRELMFLTKETAVTEIGTEKSKINKDESQYFSLKVHFMTEIRKETSNKDFRDKLLNAFQKAGCDVSSTYWID